MQGLILLAAGHPADKGPGIALATVLSIAALVVAGLALFISWRGYRHTVERDKRQEQRSVKVTCREAVTSRPVSVYNQQAGTVSSTLAVLEVRAVNAGFRPVEVRGVHFLTANGNTMFGIPLQGISETLPKRIGDGESVGVFFSKETLDAEATKHGDAVAYAVVSDADQKTYSAPYPTA